MAINQAEDVLRDSMELRGDSAAKRRSTHRGQINDYDIYDNEEIIYEHKEYMRTQVGNTTSNGELAKFHSVKLFGHEIFYYPSMTTYSLVNYAIYCIAALMPMIIFFVQSLCLYRLRQLNMSHFVWITVLFVVYELYAILNSIYICPLFLKLNQTFGVVFETQYDVLLRIVVVVVLVMFPWIWFLDSTERIEDGTETIELKCIITFTCMVHYTTLLYMMFHLATLMRQEQKKSMKRDKNLIRVVNSEYWYMRHLGTNEDEENKLFFRRMRVYQHYKSKLLFFLCYTAVAFALAVASLAFIVMRYGRVGVLESLYSTCCMLPLMGLLVMINQWNAKVKQFEKEKNIDTNLLVKVLWTEVKDESLYSVAFFVVSFVIKTVLDP